MTKEYLTDLQLAERFGVSRTSIWRWHRNDPTFPQARSLSKGCTRWVLAEIEAWEAEKANAA